MKRKLKLKKNIKKGLVTILLLLTIYTIVTCILFAASDYIHNKEIETTEKKIINILTN